MFTEIHVLILTVGQFFHPNFSPGAIATLLFLMLFSLLVAGEQAFAYKKLTQAIRQRSYRTNIGLFIFNSIVVSFLTACSLLLVSRQFADNGLLAKITNPFGQCLIAFLCLDLLLYVWHLLCHRFDALWLFHRVHHSDLSVNVSTAFRVHIVELVFTTILKSITVIVLGLDKNLLILIEAITTSFVMFHHTNCRFPGEKWLGRLFIVPFLHRSHHSTERSEHDHNYGAVLSIWDQLFGTLQLVEPVAMGIKTPAPQTALGLVCFGFGYTQKPAVAPVQAAIEITQLDAMIAEAAYYRAEKRAFSPGDELNDWLEAKREILGAYSIKA